MVRGSAHRSYHRLAGSTSKSANTCPKKRLPDPSRRMGTGSQALTYCAARMVSGKGQLNSRSTPKWDNFIMLLSADWALEFWPLMGLRLSVEERLKVQSAARNVTKK